MQVKAFKGILVQGVNKQGCKDYENTFARMESEINGFIALIKSILYT